MKRIRGWKLCGAMALVAFPGVFALAASRPGDYAQGLVIDVLSQRPIVQLSVPDVVYQRVASDALSDVRVFNGDGMPVPHALCTAPQTQTPAVSQEMLPVYRLQDIPNASSDGTRVEVQTPGGAQIRVQGQHQEVERQPGAYVIDARAVSDEIRAVQFDWSSPDGASEVRVSLQASDDLDRWETLVARSTLLSVQAGEQQLRRHRVAIPQTRYQYLRVARVDRGPPLQIDGVVAERVRPPVALEPMWFFANPVATEASELTFDAARRAPITYARLALSQDNTSLRLAIESRDDPKANWTTRWSGEAYSIVTKTERRVSPPAQFVASADRYWRVRLTTKGETFSQVPSLELGYLPARLRFLAQGQGPFTLAFGSRRAEPTMARGCESLLADLKPEDREQNIGEGLAAGTPTSLGGDDALRPLPKPTPLRQIVLWGVLILGVGMLVAMALSLLRRVNADVGK